MTARTFQRRLLIGQKTINCERLSSLTRKLATIPSPPSFTLACPLPNLGPRSTEGIEETKRNPKLFVWVADVGCHLDPPM